VFFTTIAKNVNQKGAKKKKRCNTVKRHPQNRRKYLQIMYLIGQSEHIKNTSNSKTKITQY
jgi:hypothetical protein